jgi:hypothetical protein
VKRKNQREAISDGCAVVFSRKRDFTKRSGQIKSSIESSMEQGIKRIAECGI